jgi:N-acetylneuraminate lyase
MRNLDKYRGVFPAFYACYDDKGRVSKERTQGLVRHLAAKGVRGLYVSGSSGECIYQTIEERKATLEHVMEAAAGKMTVIAHIAAPSTQASVELALHAKALGADALAAIPPIYFRLPEKSIQRYWTDMVEAADMDFIIYNIPQTTGYALSVDLLKKMLKDPRVIGVKNSSMPVLDIQQFREAAGPDFVLFNGPDEQFVAGRLMGADAGIGGTYAVMPELFLAAEACIRRGDYRLAAEIQDAVNRIIMEMLGYSGSLYSVAKHLLKEQGVAVGDSRLPMEPITGAEYPKVKLLNEAIAAAVAKYGKAAAGAR